MTCTRVLNSATLALLLPLAASAWATPVVLSPEDIEPASTVSRASDATDFAGPASGPVVIDPAEGVKLLPSEGDAYASAASNFPDFPALGGDSPQSGETLDQVLHSLTVRQDSDGFSSATGTGPRRAGSSSGFDSDDDWLGLSEVLLNSTFAGSAVRSVVEARATGDAPVGFSIFGFGSFVFETAAGGPIELTDISDGWSVMLTGQRGDPNYVDTPHDDVAPDMEVNKVAMLRRLFLLAENFLVSPLGIVLETIAVLVLMFWLVFQGILVVRQGRSPTARTARKPRRPKAGAALQARRRTRRHRHRRRGVRSTVASGERN